MAKVITTELQHSGASGANVTLDSSKNVTCENNLQVDGALTVTGAINGSGASLTGIATRTQPFRNIIINGGMQVWQRGTSSNLVGYRTADRWQTGFAGTHEDPTRSKLDLTSSDTGPWAKGFRSAYRITNGNQTSVEAGDEIAIYYAVEAQDMATSGWDYTSSSSKITLQFWVRSSIAQNYYGYIRTIDGTQRAYAFETGSLSANTWTKITKTIPGDSNISFDLNSNLGMHIVIAPFYGTDRTTSGRALNTWINNDDNNRVPDMTNTWYDTNDATFDLTGVQLEVGDTATEFEHRSYGDELQRCQRYYYRLQNDSGSSSAHWYGAGFVDSQTQLRGGIVLPQHMRTAPTSFETTGTAGDYAVWNAGNTTTTCSGVPNWSSTSSSSGRLTFTVASGLNSGQGGAFRALTTDSYLAWSAEL